MSFKKILCATDFSPASQQALRRAVRMANEADGELVIAHAWYLPAPVFPTESVFPPEMIQQTIDEGRRNLDGAVRTATEAGAKRVSGTLLTGVPWAELVRLLESQAFDLCVIGAHGHTGLSRILLGSVAEKVVRHAPCSVLAVRENGDVGSASHVLVPTDFSESARHAAELAASLVAPGGVLTLLHVTELPIVYSTEFPISGFTGDLESRHRAVLAEEAKRLKPLTSARISVESRLGAPGSQVLAALDGDRAIDLVVMGSHGRTGLKRAMLGSVAEKIVRHAPCSVLVARKRV